jgi:hypothetical protein
MKSGYSQGRTILSSTNCFTLKEENSIIPKQETSCCGELKRMVVVAF